MVCIDKGLGCVGLSDFGHMPSLAVGLVFTVVIVTITLLMRKRVRGNVLWERKNNRAIPCFTDNWATPEEMLQKHKEVQDRNDAYKELKEFENGKRI